MDDYWFSSRTQIYRFLYLLVLFFKLIFIFSLKANALEVQFGHKQKETIRFTEVPFKKKTYVHVEYLKGWTVLNEYVLDQEKSSIYQQEFKRLARKNKKFIKIADDQCKSKIRVREQDDRQYLCFEAWSDQDKKSFKSWTSFVQKDLYKTRKK